MITAYNIIYFVHYTLSVLYYSADSAIPYFSDAPLYTVSSSFHRVSSCCDVPFHHVPSLSSLYTFSTLRIEGLDLHKNISLCFTNICICVQFKFELTAPATMID